MADLEDVTLDGRPLQSLRVADLKAALEERGLSKSGQKNTLIKRLKGALMLENLQRTSTPHVGLQPNSQIGEEMSQNSFIQQYLAKQQELLRQRLEREAREACDTNEQQDHTEVNNSTSCPQDVKPVLAEEHRPPGPSGGDGLFNTANDRESNRNQDVDVPPPASGSVATRGVREQQPERRSASSGAVADSDDDDSEDGEDDDDDWDGGAGRRSLREPSRPMTRERSTASCQPQQQQQQQQHMPSLLSPQLRQPTPPPSPPPELSFPLPDTPKQSPPSPDVAPPRRSPSTSSSGSSSSDSRSSSPEPQRSGHAERKPGPLTLLARKMASEDAIFEVGWHGAEGDADRQDSGAPASTAFPSRGPPEGLVSAISHTANTAGHGPYPMYPGTAQSLPGSHLTHIQVPVSVLKATETDEQDKKGEHDLERERALQLERQRKQEQAAEEERLKVLVLEREERERALEQERIERQLALEKEEREKALQRERELALERERELALAREQEEREEMERQKELERQRALELERQRVLEQERLQREKEEREERERALEQERLERERALEQERLEKERALEQERLERERALEQERLARERALEQERLARERALEQERLERERALEEERQERERIEKERVEMARLEKERIERENALEQERILRLKAIEEERERALEQQRLEREMQEKERIAREQALEQERIEREKERVEREAALEQERLEKERAEQERLEREKERMERERALEAERKEREEALQREEQEREKAKVAERERESHLPPSKRGREVGLTPLPTPSPLFTGAGRKPSAEAGEQEDAHAPVSRSEEAESPSPLSPQSSFKKFRILRDSQAQPQSAAASAVIKQPLHSPDAPPPQATSVSSSSDSHQPVAEQEQTGTDDVTGPQSDDQPIGAPAQADVAVAKPSTDAGENQAPPTPEEGGQQRGRDTKRDKKQGRRRSSSNDSSSSDSDSGSSSSRSSSGSSSSSDEKSCSPSRDRRVRKHEKDSVPQRSETPEADAEASKAEQKASSQRRETSVGERNATTDEDTCNKPHKRAIEESTEEEMPKKHQRSDRDEDKDKQTPMESDTVEAESENHQETNEEAPKAFSARKISLSNYKASPGVGSSEGDQDSGAAAGRKRRWGSSTAVTTKKPSISITTESLKSLIPDIRPSLGQDAVVDLHPEEAVLSGAEDEERERSDQDLQIRRTVTQVVHPESQENGQKEAKRCKFEEDEEEDEVQGSEDRTQANEKKVEASPPAAMETQPAPDTSHDVETNTAAPSDTLIRRSISQQKTGVSITIDDPVRTARQPSPPRGKVSSIVHVSNLVRPFTLGQLKELLGRTGTLVEDGFWIDKIKSHCYVTYCSSEEAVATRAALHGVKWPQSNPKVLRVDFCQQDELDFHKGLVTGERPGAGAAEEQGAAFGRGRAAGLPSLLPERDQWAEREREMERREKARAEREWDRDKVREFGKPGDDKEGARRSRSRERRRKERGKSKEKKTEKKEKPEDPPAKLLDDLFRKTKAAPCIYWLPLTEEQFAQKEAARAERMKEREKRTKEREKRRKEEQEEEEKKREEERKERMKGGGGGGGGEGEKDRDRERDRDRGRERDHDKRRDGYRRPGGGGGGAGGGRRSRSRSDPRDRRR